MTERRLEAPHGRIHDARRRHASLRARLVLAASLLVTAMLGASAGLTQARGEVGPWYGSVVTCNPYENSISMSPRAGANAAFNSQSIYYRIWLWQHGVGWRLDLRPSMEGMFTHERVTVGGQDNGFGGIVSISNDTTAPGWRASPGEGKYEIFTEYWWWDGFGWSQPYGAWTTWMNYTYSLSPHSTNVCDLTLV